MGEAKVRKNTDPLYGILPKGNKDSPLWTVHKGVLFLINPEKDSIACIPAGKRVEELTPIQAEALDDILKAAPELLSVEVTTEPLTKE